MAGKVISIEIGYSLTRVCETDYKSKTHKVYKNFTVPTPDGVINDGALMITGEYVDMLKKALAENKVKTKQVMFTITSAKIASREVVIPFVKENRIADVVNANASDYFPVDLSQYQLAYSILGVIGETKGTQQYKLLVMAAPIALLSGYYDLAKALKLELAAIDYAGNSIYQVVKEECKQGNNLIVKVDERSTLVMVVQNGVLSFTRNVAYGVDEAVDAVMESRQWGDIQNFSQALQVLEGNDCVMLPKQNNAETVNAQSADAEAQDAEAAETVSSGTAVEAALTVEEQTPETRAKQAVTEALQPLTGGIARVIDYYVSHNSNATIDRVLLTGMGANIRGLAELLSREINHPIEILQQAAGWNLEKNFRKEYYGEYIACVGAAAAPLGFKKEADKGKGKARGESGSKSGMAINGSAIAYTLLIVGVIVAIVLVIIPTLRYIGLQKTNTELKAQSSELQEIIPVYNEYVTTKAEYTKVNAMYEATENRNEELYDFIVELEEKLPSSVNALSFTSDVTTVTINMTVATKDDAIAAIEQLRSFDSLIGETVTVSALTTQEEEESGVTGVNFTAVALYRPIEDDVQAEESAE